jgi:L-asparagine oxygenase
MMIVLDQDLMRGTTEPARRLFEKVVHLYMLHRRQHTLQPGEVLLLDNRRAVHGRSSFEPCWNGHDRFIVRSFAVRNVKQFMVAVKPGTLTVQARYS